MKIFAIGLPFALALAACGNPIFHRNSGGGEAGPPDPEEIVPFKVEAGAWSLTVYAKRKDGPVASSPATPVPPVKTAYSFSPAVFMPFSKTESLPLTLLLEETTCPNAQGAVAENGKVNTLKGDDTYSTNFAESEPGKFDGLEVVAVKRGDNCALLTFRNGNPGKAALGPFPAVTALLIYGEAVSVQHN